MPSAQQVAVITTDGETPELHLPVNRAKVEEVAIGKVHFTAVEDEAIAVWMLEIAKILTLR